MADLRDNLFLVLPRDGDAGAATSTLSFSRSPVALLTIAGNRLARAAAVSCAPVRQRCRPCRTRVSRAS